MLRRPHAWRCTNTADSTRVASSVFVKTRQVDCSGRRAEMRRTKIVTPQVEVSNVIQTKRGTGV